MDWKVQLGKSPKTLNKKKKDKETGNEGEDKTHKELIWEFKHLTKWVQEKDDRKWKEQNYLKNNRFEFSGTEDTKVLKGVSD